MGIIWIRGSQRGRSRKLANGNVIRVTIATVRIKGNYDLWLNTPYMLDNFCYRLGRVSLIQIPINVIEKLHFADAKFLRGVEQFTLADLSQLVWSGVIFFISPPA